MAHDGKWIIGRELAARLDAEVKSASDPAATAKLVREAAAIGDMEAVDRAVKARAMWLHLEQERPKKPKAARRVTVKG